MKISEKTLNILKNFTTINPSIYVKTGSALKTISPQRSMLGIAEVEENFPQDFAIYDLNRFNAVISLLENPDFVFSEKYVTLNSGSASIRYFYADPSMIVTAPDSNIVLKKQEIQFKLKLIDLESLVKAWAILQVADIAFESKNGRLSVKALDLKNPTGDSFSIVLEENVSFGDFTAILKTENLKLLKNSYDVTICSSGICRFVSPDAIYFVTLENNSVFN